MPVAEPTEAPNWHMQEWRITVTVHQSHLCRLLLKERNHNLPQRELIPYRNRSQMQPSKLQRSLKWQMGRGPRGLGNQLYLGEIDREMARCTV